MYVSMLTFTNPPNELKRSMYVRLKLITFLQKKQMHINRIPQIRLIRQSEEDEIVNHVFGRANVRISETKHVVGKHEKHRRIKETEKFRDQGYGSLETDGRVPKQPVPNQIRPEDVLICLLSKDEDNIHLIGQDIQSALNIENDILFFSDSMEHKFEAILNQTRSNKSSATKQNLVETAPSAFLEHLASRLESALIDEMRVIKSELCRSNDGVEEGVYEEHDVDTQQLDKLIDICMRPKVSTSVPDDLEEILTKSDKVKGFGVLHNKFVIYLQQGASDSEREFVLNEAAKFYVKRSIEVQEKESELCIPHSLGCGNRLNKENGQSGSVGFCCKMRRESGNINLVIVTASHVLNMNEHVYMSINNNSVDVGKCIYSPNEGCEDTPSLFDIAVVEIKNDMEGHFHCDVLDKSNGRQSFKILPGICDIYTQVWKHGATTHLTTGVVTSPEFTINSNGKLRNVTIIEGITKDFAEPGDSGASVLLQEAGETYGLGVIVGESSADQHPPDESTKNCITARLNKAIERFESNTKNKLLIGTAD